MSGWRSFIVETPTSSWRTFLTGTSMPRDKQVLGWQNSHLFASLCGVRSIGMTVAVVPLDIRNRWSSALHTQLFLLTFATGGPPPSIPPLGVPNWRHEVRAGGASSRGRLTGLRVPYSDLIGKVVQRGDKVSASDPPLLSLRFRVRPGGLAVSSKMRSPVPLPSLPLGPSLPRRPLSFGSRFILEGRCKATWKREFILPWRETGPPNHHADRVDSNQKVVNKELSLCNHCLHSGIRRKFRIETWSKCRLLHGGLQGRSFESLNSP